MILEQLLIETGLRIIVLDPELGLRPAVGRCARTSTPRRRSATATPRAASRCSPAVPPASERLRLRLAELTPAAQAALLRLDPIADRDEHAELVALLAEETPPTVEALLASPRPDAQRLGLRARNLGIERFGALGGAASRARCST